jgi:hypothetical protein
VWWWYPAVHTTAKNTLKAYETEAENMKLTERECPLANMRNGNGP